MELDVLKATSNGITEEGKVNVLGRGAGLAVQSTPTCSVQCQRPSIRNPITPPPPPPPPVIRSLFRHRKGPQFIPDNRKDNIITSAKEKRAGRFKKESNRCNRLQSGLIQVPRLCKKFVFFKIFVKIKAA